MRFLLLLACLSASVMGCGYRIISPDVGGGRTISVPPTVNASIWYGIEVGLTREVRADLQRQLDIRLVSPNGSDFTLNTKIDDVGRRARVALRSGGAALGLAQLSVKWEFLDAQGKVLGSGVIRRNLEFLTDLNEDAYSAFDEIFVEISQQIALEVGALLAHLPQP
ncbi:MAG: LPS assembly lipoprotein LptE [Planctomycetota bacterium]